MGAINIKNLHKSYKNFNLDIKELEVKEGFVTGFIGPNGAGKTTTIKSIMGMNNIEGGEITVFGKNLLEDLEVKAQVGYVGEHSGYIEESKVLDIKKSVAPFYKNWDEERYKELIKKFALDENKTYKDLSAGQRKQFDLTMTLSHHPKLLIMDEPTANLDPIIRDKFLNIIQDTMVKEELTVFYSTHLTTDLEKCSDYIILLLNGKVALNCEKDEIMNSYAIVKGKKDLLDSSTRKEFVYVEENPFGFEGLTSNREKTYEVFGEEVVYEKATLDEIMLFYSKGEK